MKHFVSGFAAQPLSMPVIQSVLNHSQSAWVTMLSARFLGIYWRIKPLKFLSLPEFNISDAMLIASKFDEADLRGAKIGGCQLQGCSFRLADLSNADFRSSTLYGCWFENANTHNAKGLL